MVRPTPWKAARRFRNAAARFRRAEGGAIAVEFALISGPLFLMIFGIIEIAMMLLATSSLQLASDYASRQIRTGEFQQGAPSLTAFRAEVCERMSWLGGSCDDNLVVEAQTFASYDAMANAPEPALILDGSASGANTQTSGGAPLPFQVGAPCDIVLVRTYYRWRLFTPLMGRALASAGNDGSIQMLSATTAFRNEPYDVNPTASVQC